MQSNEQPDLTDIAASSTTDSGYSDTTVVQPLDSAAAVPRDNYSNPVAATPLNRPHGVVAYYCGLLFFEFLLLGILYSDPHELIALTASGLITGQLAFTAIATSLMSRNWVEGVLIGAVGLLGILIAAWLPTAFRGGAQSIVLLTAFALPAICFISTLPLICMRWWFGWRLTLATDKLHAPSRLSIEDMILVPSAVAAMFVAGNLSGAFGDQLLMAPSFSSLLFVSIPALVICLLVVVPATYWYFRGADIAAGLAGAAGYLLACFFVMLFLVIAISNGRVPPAFLGWLIGFLFIASLIGLLGLHVIRASGYRLTRFAESINSMQPAASVSTDASTDVGAASIPEPPAIATPFDLDAPEVTQSEEDLFERKRRVRFRIAVAAVVAASALLNVAIWSFSRRHLDHILARITADGGVIESTGDHVTSIDFGPNNVDTYLRELPSIESLREIKLNRAPDAQLWHLRKFGAMQSLDLRNLNFDSRMLPTSVPIGVKLTMWHDQLSKQEFDDLKRFGFVVEQIER